MRDKLILEENSTKSFDKYDDEWRQQVMDICSKSDIADMFQEIAREKEDYKKAIQYFINRVEGGSIKSKATYKMYKDLIKKYE